MSEKDQLNMIRCPRCEALILHDDLRITGTFAGSAEVKAHCTLCDQDVLFGYVDTWIPTEKKPPAVEEIDLL